MAIGALGGGPLSSLYRRPQTTQYTPEAAFPRAIQQQAGDYDRIMQGYEGVLNTPNPEYGSLMSRYQQLLQQNQAGPSLASYEETPEFREAFANAREMSRTGGLSDADQSNLRARGVSPIRSVYQNAQRNMERQARLSGGRSANYNASASRMAREQSESMAGAMQNVNAGIAEMVQRGRLAAMPEMSRMGEGSSGRRTQVELANADARNQHGRTTADILANMRALMDSDQNRRTDALRGMTSLYGTTPALVNTFGNQVQNNQQLQETRRQNSQNNRYRAGGLYTNFFGS